MSHAENGVQGIGLPWARLMNCEVVLDMQSPFVYLGKLVALHGEFLELVEVDAHDLRDTSTTRDKYVLDARVHGISPNRARVWVHLRDLVSASRLDEVLLP